MFNTRLLKKLSFSMTLALLGVSSQLVVAEDSPEAPAQYQSSCFACHSSGAAGAPKTGDADAWAARMAQGKEAMLASVKNGKGAMPASGLCADCSDEDFVQLIEFMSGMTFKEE